MQAQDQDIALALSICMTKDGQQTATSNLPMGGFTLKNIGNASVQGNPVSVMDFQNGTPIMLTGVSGTDTITGAVNIAPAAYALGQTFRGIAAGANLTNAVTLNVNGLGAIPVKKGGSNPLAPGDFAAGQVFEVTYDGTNFQVVSVNNGHGALVNIQLLTASGTYTPTTGATNGFAWVQGDGAAGGGTINLSGNYSLAGGGGSAGTFAIVRLPTLTSQAVTIGTGGAGVSGATGGNGTGTSFGTLCVCPGGIGGSADGGTHGGTAGPADVGGLGGAPAGIATGTGDIIFCRQGAAGTPGIALLNPLGGSGGASYWGIGGQGSAAGGGLAGGNYGGGGAGAARIATGGVAAAAGFNGAQGAVLVFEYA